MIYSRDHKFLLIKNKKVGGTSIEVELSKVLPNNAIVTKIYPSNPNHVPRNDAGFYNHMSYSEIKNKINLRNVLSYIIVRHPYDMVFSYLFDGIESFDRWKNLTKKEQDILVDKYFDPDIENFFPDMKNKMLLSTKYLFLDNNNMIYVNKFIKYENNLEEQINEILSNHKIQNISLNTWEKVYKPKSLLHGDIFKDRHYKLIQKEWFWELENLGYNI